MAALSINGLKNDFIRYLPGGRGCSVQFAVARLDEVGMATDDHLPRDDHKIQTPTLHDLIILKVVRRFSRTKRQ